MDKKIYKVFDYLEWRGDLDFDASPFNEIDAAILCLLSYLDISGKTIGNIGEVDNPSRTENPYRTPAFRRKIVRKT